MSEKGLRTRRVAELVQAELSRLLITEFQDAASGLLTVTRVEMTPDLLTARVFLSVFGTAGPRRAPRPHRAGQGRPPAGPCLPHRVEV